MLVLDERQQNLLMTLKQSMTDENNKNNINNKINEIKTNDKIHNNIINKDVVMDKINQTQTRIICKRGEIFYSDLAGNQGSEQGGYRPVIIIQNDIGNRYSPTVIVAVVTSQVTKSKLPTHQEVSAQQFGLEKDSVILLEQIRTLDKRRLKEKIGMLDELTMRKMDKSLGISVGLIVEEQKQQTLLEKLSDKSRQYIVNKIRFIERAKESIDFYKSIKGDKHSIELAEDEKFREENALLSYCDYNKIDYKEIYKNYIELYVEKYESIAL